MPVADWLTPLLFFTIACVAIFVGIFVGRTSDVPVVIPTVPPPSVIPSVIPSPIPVITITPPRTEVLFDNFEVPGAGFLDLTAHTPEVGGPWVVYNAEPVLEIEESQGYCTSATLGIDTNRAWAAVSYDMATTFPNGMVGTLKFTIPSGLPAGGESTVVVIAPMKTTAGADQGEGIGVSCFLDLGTNMATFNLWDLQNFSNPFGTIDTTGNFDFTTANTGGTTLFDTEITMTFTIIGNAATSDINDGLFTLSGTAAGTRTLNNTDQLMIGVLRTGGTQLGNGVLNEVLIDDL